MNAPPEYAVALNAALSFYKSLAESEPAQWKAIDFQDYSHTVDNPQSIQIYHDVDDPTLFRFCTTVTTLAEPRDWYAALNSPTLRRAWDRYIADLEYTVSLNPNVHIINLIYKVGWVASLRELHLISTTLIDQSSVLHVSTSLPLSPANRLSITSTVAHATLLSWSIQKQDSDHVDSSPDNTYSITVFWKWDLKYWTGALGQLEPPIYISKMISDLTSYLPVFNRQSPLVTDFGESIETHSQQIYNQLGSNVSIFECEYKVNLSSQRNSFNQDFVHKMKKDLGISISKSSMPPGRILIYLSPPDYSWSIDLHVEREGNGVLGWKAAVETNAKHGYYQLRVDHDIPQSEKEYLFVTLRIRPGEKDARHIFVNGRKIKVQTEESSGQQQKRRGEYLKPLLPRKIDTLETSSRPFEEKLTMNDGFRKVIQDKLGWAYKSLLQYHSSTQWKLQTSFSGVNVAHIPVQGRSSGVIRRQVITDGSSWDLVSCILFAQRVWDNGWIERYNVLDRLDEKCSLIYIKTRSTWSTSARDFLIAQSRTITNKAIYVYSISIEDPVILNAYEVPTDYSIIRAKIDLFAWVIDQADSQTCRVSQYVLADWKGWSSASNLFQPFWSSFQECIAYNSTYGGLPILVNLTSANLVGMVYEHTKSLVRIEYKANFPSKSPNLDDENQDFSPTSCTSELRINTTGWSRNAELVVHPPPYNVKCTHKYRDKAIWLTIQHTNVALSSGRIVIVIRRGVETRKSDTIIVNGAKHFAEPLPKDLGTLLQRKHSSPPTAARLDITNWKTPSSEHVDTASVMSVSAGSRNRNRDSGPEDLTTSNNSGSNSVSTSVTSVQMEPIQIGFHALEGLYSLVRNEDDSWVSLASRKGVKLAKKIDTAISPNIPIMKGEMVMEGFDADEIMSVITCLCARKIWDDTFDKGHILATFGSGCEIVHLDFKSPLSFLKVKGREMQMVTVISRFTRDAVSPITSPTFPSAIFIASASFASRNSNADSQMQTPSTFTNVILDGWVLENIDPYTMASNFAIPSTRVTRVECIDFGNMTYLQNLISSSVPRILNGVYSYLKTYGPTPYAIQPPGMIEIIEDQAASIAQASDYDIEELDQSRTLLQSTFEHENNTYRVCLFLDLVEKIAASRLRAWKASITTLENNANQSSNMNSSKSQLVIDITTASPARGALSLLDSHLNRSSASLNAMPTKNVERRSSTSSLASRQSQKSVSSSIQEIDEPDDFVVLDLLIDASRYPYGYVLTTFAYSPRETDENFILPSSLDLEDLPSPLRLPLASFAYDIRAPPSYAASLNRTNSKPFKHLIRMTLPAIVDESQGVQGPSKAQLTSLDRGWWHSLINGKFVLDVRLNARTEGKMAIYADGDIVKLENGPPGGFYHNALVVGGAMDATVHRSSGGGMRLRRLLRSGDHISSKMQLPDVLKTPIAFSSSGIEERFRSHLDELVSLSDQDVLTPRPTLMDNRRTASSVSNSTVIGHNCLEGDHNEDADEGALEIEGAAEPRSSRVTTFSHRPKFGERSGGMFTTSQLLELANETVSRISVAVYAASVNKKSRYTILLIMFVMIIFIFVKIYVNTQFLPDNGDTLAISPVPIVYANAKYIESIKKMVGTDIETRVVRYAFRIFGMDILVARVAM